jgi:hypothetical protein
MVAGRGRRRRGVQRRTGCGHWLRGCARLDHGPRELFQREEIRQTARNFSRVPLTYYPDETHGVGPGGQFLAEGNFIVEDGLGVIFPSPVAFENLFASYGYPAGSCLTSRFSA